LWHWAIQTQKFALGMDYAVMVVQLRKVAVQMSKKLVQ